MVQENSIDLFLIQSSFILFILIFWTIIKININKISKNISKKSNQTEIVKFSEEFPSVYNHLRKLKILDFPLWHLAVFSFILAPEFFYSFFFIESFQSPFFQAIGILILGFFLLIYINLLGEMKESWRIGTKPQKAGQLVNSGLFKYVRHPIYASMLFIYVASFLIVPNLVFAALLFIGVIAAYAQAKSEEYFLLNEFGKQYSDYMKKTSMFFPKIF